MDIGNIRWFLRTTAHDDEGGLNHLVRAPFGLLQVESGVVYP